MQRYKFESNSQLSQEVNEFGKPFVLSSDGTTTMGEIPEESGLTAAPIKLSQGENTVDENGRNHGYGLLHIEADHGNQIRSAGFNSVEEFVEEVAKNYDTIREGNEVAGNQTYLLELSDEHNNTLFIQLSRDGSYWNVNSAGIFRKKYSRRKREVASLPTIGNSSSTETVEVNRGQLDGAAATSENSSMTSEGKVSEEVSDMQENPEKTTDKSDVQFRVVEEKRNAEDNETIFGAAKKKFGVTNDLREAGYILPDGSMLDFSGRHELFGADDSFLKGRRTTDHRGIDQVAYEYDAEGNEVETGVETDMPDFIGRGAIRIDNNAGTINLSMAPTPEQARALRRLIANNDGDVSGCKFKCKDTNLKAIHNSTKATEAHNN